MPHFRGTTCDISANQQLTVGAVEAPYRAFVASQTVSTVR
jgi:hypothetical protein